MDKVKVTGKHTRRPRPPVPVPGKRTQRHDRQISEDFRAHDRQTRIEMTRIHPDSCDWPLGMTKIRDKTG